ncbi:MAG: LLM class flavin-dependent oxidoreductase, partial [Candidatus Binataceae bacterium]
RYYAFGADAAGAAEKSLGAYYPEPYARQVINGALTSEQAVKECAAGFDAAGCDEMVFFCCAPDISQVDRLAEVLGTR